MPERSTEFRDESHVLGRLPSGACGAADRLALIAYLYTPSVAANPERDFLDVRTHGFARVAVCVPETRVADPGFNADAHLEQLEAAYARRGALRRLPRARV